MGNSSHWTRVGPYVDLGARDGIHSRFAAPLRRELRPWQVATRSVAVGSERGRWVRPSAASPRPACASPSGARTGTRRSRASPATRRCPIPGTARAVGSRPARTGTTPGAAAHRTVQDASGVRTGEANGCRRRGNSRRSARQAARRDLTLRRYATDVTRARPAGGFFSCGPGCFVSVVPLPIP